MCKTRSTAVPSSPQSGPLPSGSLFYHDAGPRSAHLAVAIQAPRPLSDVRRLAIEDRGPHARRYLLPGEADLRVQQRGLAVGHIAVGQADAQDPRVAGGGA